MIVNERQGAILLTIMINLAVICLMIGLITKDTFGKDIGDIVDLNADMVSVEDATATLQAHKDRLVEIDSATAALIVQYKDQLDKRDKLKRYLRAVKIEILSTQDALKKYIIQRRAYEIESATTVSAIRFLTDRISEADDLKIDIVPLTDAAYLEILADKIIPATGE